MAAAPCRVLQGAKDFRTDADLHVACKADADSVCKDVKAGEGRIQDCLVGSMPDLAFSFQMATILKRLAAGLGLAPCGCCSTAKQLSCTVVAAVCLILPLSCVRLIRCCLEQPQALMWVTNRALQQLKHMLS